MAKSKNTSVMDKMAMYINTNQKKEIESKVNSEPVTITKPIENSVEEKSTIEKAPIQDEIKNEETSNSNISSEFDVLYRTKNYDMFLPYPNEELRLPLHTGAKFEALRDSLVKHGMNTPIKVIKAETSEFGGEKGKLIVLGGHNRLEIAKEYGLEVLYYILPLTETSQTDIIMAEEVLLNRQIEELLPTQIFSLLKAMYSNGISIRQISTKLDENSSLALGKSSISNYLKIENIIYEFKKWVDENRIPVRQISNFSKIEYYNQKILIAYCQKKEIIKLNVGQIDELVSLKDFTDEALDKIFFQQRKVETKKTFKIDINDVNDIIPDEDLSKAKDIIRAALKMFYETNRN